MCTAARSALSQGDPERALTLLEQACGIELSQANQPLEGLKKAAQALPDQHWIAELEAELLLQTTLQGEQLAHGLGPRGYGLWLDHCEPHLPPPVLRLRQRWWLDSVPPGVCDGWLVLVAEDVRLRPGALQVLEAALYSWSGELPDLLYADEDWIDASGGRHTPWFKPGWVPESFWSTPWLESFSAWRLSWLLHAGLAPPPPAGTARFAWLLAALERTPRIGHVPRVLVHRFGPSDAANPTRAALLGDHLQRLGEGNVQVRARQDPYGSYSLVWPLPPGITCRVVIPTRNRADLLEACLRSLEATVQGLAFEVMVVDNGSTEPNLADLLERWSQRMGPRFLSLRQEEAFNWSQLSNRGAEGATTTLLLFLNNDVEADRPGWCEAMASQALRPAVGCVGANLRYPDGTLQHGGVVVGMHGGADHAYRGLRPSHGVHRGRSRCLSGWGAVTGACLMVRRELFE